MSFGPLDRLNGQPTYDTDVALWCAAHFADDVQGEPPGEHHGRILGPRLAQAARAGYSDGGPKGSIRGLAKGPSTPRVPATRAATSSSTITA
jgi:hypothetical protein